MREISLPLSLSSFFSLNLFLSIHPSLFLADTPHTHTHTHTRLTQQQQPEHILLLPHTYIYSYTCTYTHTVLKVADSRREREREKENMVLAELGSKITSALRKVNDVTVVDEGKA
jgi:hypothetical protein